MEIRGALSVMFLLMGLDLVSIFGTAATMAPRPGTTRDEGPQKTRRNLQYLPSTLGSRALNESYPYFCTGYASDSNRQTVPKAIACFGISVNVQTGILATCSSGLNIIGGSVVKLTENETSSSLGTLSVPIPCSFPPDYSPNMLIAAAMLDMDVGYDCLQDAWAVESVTFMYTVTACQYDGQQVVLTPANTTTYTTLVTGFPLPHFGGSTQSNGVLLAIVQDGVQNTFDGCAKLYTQGSVQKGLNSGLRVTCPPTGAPPPTYAPLASFIDVTRPYFCFGTVFANQLGYTTPMNDECVGTPGTLATGTVNAGCFSTASSAYGSQVVFGGYNTFFSQLPLCAYAPSDTGFVAMALLSWGNITDACSTSGHFYISEATFVYAPCTSSQSSVSLNLSSNQFSARVTVRPYLQSPSAVDLGYVLTSISGKLQASKTCTYLPPAGELGCPGPALNSSYVDETKPVICFVSLGDLQVDAEVCIGTSADLAKGGVEAPCQPMFSTQVVMGGSGATWRYSYQQNPSSEWESWATACSPPLLDPRDGKAVMFMGMALVNLTVQDTCHASGTWTVLDATFAFEPCVNGTGSVLITPSSPLFTSPVSSAIWTGGTLLNVTTSGGSTVSYANSTCVYGSPDGNPAPYYVTCPVPEIGGASWQQAVSTWLDGNSTILCLGATSTICFGGPHATSLDAGIVVTCGQISTVFIEYGSQSEWFSPAYAQTLNTYQTCNSLPNQGPHGFGMLLIDVDFINNCGTAFSQGQLGNVTLAYADCSSDGTAKINSTSPRFNTFLYTSQPYSAWPTGSIEAVWDPVSASLTRFNNVTCSLATPYDCFSSSIVTQVLGTQLGNPTSACVVNSVPGQQSGYDLYCFGPSKAVTSPQGIQVTCQKASSAASTIAGFCYQRGASSDLCTSLPFSLCNLPEGVTADTPIALALVSFDSTFFNVSSQYLYPFSLSPTSSPTMLVWNMPSAQIAYEICSSPSAQVTINASSSPVFTAILAQSSMLVRRSLVGLTAPDPDNPGSFSMTSYSQGIPYYMGNSVCAINSDLTLAISSSNLVLTNHSYFCTTQSTSGLCYGGIPELAGGLTLPCSPMSNALAWASVVSIQFPLSVSAAYTNPYTLAAERSGQGINFPWCELPVAIMLGTNKTVDLSKISIAIAMVNGGVVRDLHGVYQIEGDFLYELCEGEYETEGYVNVSLSTSPTFHASVGNYLFTGLTQTFDGSGNNVSTVSNSQFQNTISPCPSYAPPFIYPNAPETNDSQPAMEKKLRRMSKVIDSQQPMVCLQANVHLAWGMANSELEFCIGTPPLFHITEGFDVDCSLAGSGNAVYGGFFDQVSDSGSELVAEAQLSTLSTTISTTSCSAPPLTDLSSPYALVIKHLYIESNGCGSGLYSIGATLAYAVCSAVPGVVRVNSSSPTFNATLAVLGTYLSGPGAVLNTLDVIWIDGRTSQNLSDSVCVSQHSACSVTTSLTPTSIRQTIDTSLTYVCTDFSGGANPQDNPFNYTMSSYTAACLGTSNLLTGTGLSLQFTGPTAGSVSGQYNVYVQGGCIAIIDGDLSTNQNGCTVMLVLDTLPTAIFPVRISP